MNGPVYALVFGPDGSLYASGGFDTAGGVTANCIARWDPATSSWHPLGIGMEGGYDYGPRVSALAFGPDGSLYAGGRFTTAGGVAVNHIARWNLATSSWHPLGSGMGGDYLPFVFALAFGPDDSLYTGGIFTTAGGVAARFIACWDPATSSWHPLGSGMNGGVLTLAFGPDGSLYAGGEFDTAGGVTASFIARWDGSEWHPLGSGMNGSVRALAVGPDGSLYAGGSFTTAGGVAANYIARWDGTQWQPLGSGMDGDVRALAFGPDGSLYAGGSFTTAGGKPSSNIAQWTGAVLRPAIWFPVVLMEQ